jgi:hypothetical protein
MQLETISAVVGQHADTIELSFDPVHAGCMVWYRYPEVSAMPCMDPDRPLTPSELEEERRELYPDDDDDDDDDDAEEE